MRIEASINPTWAIKWILLGVALLVFAGWSWYDGAVGYPEHNRRVAEFQRHMESDELKAKWPAYARSQGWSDEEPDGARSEFDITTQYVMMAVLIPLGLAAVGLVLFHRGRKLVADEDGLVGSTGEQATYSSISSIDKVRWDAKGIAVVHYVDKEGQEETIKVDDWVFRDAELVLEEVERQTGLGDLPGD